MLASAKGVVCEQRLRGEEIRRSGRLGNAFEAKREEKGGEVLGWEMKDGPRMH